MLRYVVFGLSMWLVAAHAKEIDVIAGEETKARWTIETSEVQTYDNGFTAAVVYVYDENGRTPAYIAVKGCANGSGAMLISTDTGDNNSHNPQAFHWRLIGNRVHDRLAEAACLLSAR